MKDHSTNTRLPANSVWNAVKLLELDSQKVHGSSEVVMTINRAWSSQRQSRLNPCRSPRLEATFLASRPGCFLRRSNVYYECGCENQRTHIRVRDLGRQRRPVGTVTVVPHSFLPLPCSDLSGHTQVCPRWCSVFSLKCQSMFHLWLTLSFLFCRISF